jgi:general secretion pathway protein J
VKQKQSGFTLIELLVAMAISAVIAVLAYQSIAEVTDVSQNLEGKSTEFADLQRAIWWIEQDFAQMAPRTVQDVLGSSLPAYWVQPDRVELTRIALYPSPYGISGLVRVAYSVDNKKLIRWVWPVLDRAPNTEPQKIEILDGVTQFEVRQLNAQKAWQTNWPEAEQSATELPGLVEIRFNYAGFGDLRRLILGVDGLAAIAGAGKSTGTTTQ